MKLFKIFIVVALVLLLTSPVFGEVGTKNNGSVLNAATDIDFSTGLVATSDGSTTKVVTSSKAGHPTVLVSATPASLSTTKDGTTFIATGNGSTGSKRFWLPPLWTLATGDIYSASGVTLTFVSGAGTWGSEIDVNLGDTHSTIFYTSSGTSLQGIRATVMNDSDSYPTISLKAYGGQWYVINAKGSWALYTQ